MDSENYIQCVKDFIISKTPRSGWFSVTKESIPSQTSPNSLGHGSSKYANEILKCVQILVDNPVYIKFCVFKSPINPSSSVFYVYIDPAFCQTLNRVIPRCSIQVLLKLQYSGATELQTHEKRLDIFELGKYGSPHQPVLDTYGMSLDSNFGTVSADVIIRLPETNMSKIQLSTNYFLQNLFEKESSKDLKIVVGSGVEVECHRIVFEAHSNVLTAMLSPENGLSESRTGRVVLKDNSEAGIRIFIRYLYGMEIIMSDMSCDVTVELFQLAHKYEMKELEDHLLKFLLLQEKDWFRPDSLLELYFHVKNSDDFKTLQDHALTNLLGLSLEVRNCERFKELNRTDPAAAAELLFKLLDLKP